MGKKFNALTPVKALEEAANVLDTVVSIASKQEDKDTLLSASAIWLEIYNRAVGTLGMEPDKSLVFGFRQHGQYDRVDEGENE